MDVTPVENSSLFGGLTQARRRLGEPVRAAEHSIPSPWARMRLSRSLQCRIPNTQSQLEPRQAKTASRARTRLPSQRSLPSSTELFPPEQRISLRDLLPPARRRRLPNSLAIPIHRSSHSIRLTRWIPQIPTAPTRSRAGVRHLLHWNHQKRRAEQLGFDRPAAWPWPSPRPRPRPSEL